ncbi:MAG: hypothetical protein AMS23_00230 [Bacteroides sp. SM1_62]|nr:MAG: hypothetical protein AMS23_00230 [Bacteroides sp. SM1_62]
MLDTKEIIMKAILRIMAISFIIVVQVYGQQKYLRDVPDYSQPPMQTLLSTSDISNYCAPFAVVNIIEFWEKTNSHPYALNLMAGLPGGEVAEYLGWFMDTNDNGDSIRWNGTTFPSALGTYTVDQDLGALDYISCDSINLNGFPYTLPAGKKGYSWVAIPEPVPPFPSYMQQIDEGNPVKVDFLYWNIQPTGFYFYDSLFAADTIYFYAWGDPVPTSGTQDESDPPEQWNLEPGEEGIGHAVTGVGYFPSYVPPGSPDPPMDYLVVHDNWANTPKNIAIPWQNVSAMLSFILPPVPDLTVLDIQTTVAGSMMPSDTLILEKPVNISNTVENIAGMNMPGFLIITNILDPNGLKIVEDSMYYKLSPAKLSSVPAGAIFNVDFDSMFTPHEPGPYVINSQVFWDQNGDSIINDPPDADPGNDHFSVPRIAIYQVIYTTINIIPGVPDINQPPIPLIITPDLSNYCAPTSAANITLFWDTVVGHSNALGVNAGLPGETAANYIGWFMDTNDQGNPFARNGDVYPPAKGTYILDQDSLLTHFIRWDTLNPYPNAPSIPSAKTGYDWNFTSDYSQGFPFYETEINDGRPVKVDFTHWNIYFSGSVFIDTIKQDTAYIYNWGSPVINSFQVNPEAPPEEWNLEEGLDNIGHAVTGVGYVIHTHPNPYYAVVHDNWPTTHKNVAIPWASAYWKASLAMDPTSTPIANEDMLPIIRKFYLGQNYPNPFNSLTRIDYHLPEESHVSLTVYTITGQQLEILISQRQKAGKYYIYWSPQAISSGIYFYKLEAGTFLEIKKMVLIQ